MQLRIIISFFVFFSSTVFSFYAFDGEFTAKKQCNLFQSFKKKTQLKKNHQTTIDKKYRILGTNKIGGEWLQIRDGTNNPTWVNVKCGVIQKNNTPNFDFFTLTFSWIPTFCLINKESKKLSFCNKKTPYIGTHGLWPSRNKKFGPTYCLIEFYTENTLLPKIDIKPELFRKLQRIMPGTENSLELHEWHKHGSCSGMDVDTYYTRTCDYSRWFLDSSVARKIKKHAGKKIYSNNINSWFKSWQAGHAFSIHCVKDNGIYILKEIRIYLNKNLPITPNNNSLIKCPVKINIPDTLLLPNFVSKTNMLLFKTFLLS